MAKIYESEAYKLISKTLKDDEITMSINAFPERKVEWNKIKNKYSCFTFSESKEPLSNWFLEPWVFLIDKLDDRIFCQMYYNYPLSISNEQTSNANIEKFEKLREAEDRLRSLFEFIFKWNKLDFVQKNDAPAYVYVKCRTPGEIKKDAPDNIERLNVDVEFKYEKLERFFDRSISKWQKQQKRPLFFSLGMDFAFSNLDKDKQSISDTIHVFICKNQDFTCQTASDLMRSSSCSSRFPQFHIS